MARWRLELPLYDISRIAVSAYLGTPFDGDRCLYGRRADVSPAWPAIRGLIFQAEQELYASEGASGNPADEGIPWKGNAGTYGLWKAEDFGTGPGVLTGALMRQLTGESGDHLERSGPNYFLFGSNAPVGQWSGKVAWDVWGHPHVWSTDSDSEDVGGLLASGGAIYREPSGLLSKFPTTPRPPISLRDDQMDEIEETVVDYVTQAPRVSGVFGSGRLARQRAVTASGEETSLIRGFGTLRRSRM